MDEKELISLAKGVDPRAQYLNVPDANGNKKQKEEYITKRRKTRRLIHQIRKYKHRDKEPTEEMKVLISILDEQLNPDLGLSWTSFTFAWDIHPHYLAKIILKEHWVKEGGGFDTELGTHYPTAFTKQEIL